MRLRAAVGVIAVAVLTPSLARAQANVNESLETAFIWVDAVNGSDSNPGTQQLPLQTLGAAASLAETNNQNGIGTRVTVNPGTYREDFSLTAGSGTTSLPITFEAATNGTAIVSGAEAWTGWQPYSANPQIYTNSWPYQWGECSAGPAGPFQPPVVLRREMIFVNSTPLTQVLSINEMLPGTFYVDEAGATVYIWPPAGTNVGSADIEVSTLGNLLNVAQSYVVMRGLTFQYSNSCFGYSAVSVSDQYSNVLFDTDNFLWNNGVGLLIEWPISYYTVENSVANHNGELGFEFFQLLYGLLQSDQAGYNDWREAQGDDYGDAAGARFFHAHDLTVNGLQTFFNQTFGAHVDADGQNITMDSLSSYQDLNPALFVEISEGPVSVSNSSFCTSGTVPVNVPNSGLAIRNSELVTLTGSDVLNYNADLDVSAMDPGGAIVTNWQTGQTYVLFTENLTLMNDIFETGAGQDVFLDATGNPDWPDFTSTFSSNDNTWWDASNSTPFSLPVPTNPTYVNFSGWQATTGQDQQSVFAEPSGTPACTVVSPDIPDYWFLVDQHDRSLTVYPAASAVWTASTFPLNFTGTITLSDDGAENIPGASASWSATSVTPGGSAVLTVTTGASTPAGTYPVVMLANSGSLTHTVTLEMTVNTTVQISTSSLNFGDQAVGTESAPQTVTLTNTGAAPLTITGITLSSSQSFSEVNNCGTSLAGNSSCNITVTFAPLVAGNLSDTLNIIDGTTPQQVTLTGTGTGPLASVSPSSLSFGDQPVGTTSAVQSVTLSNTGNVTLSITSIAVGGSNAGDFGETNTCGSSLAAGASCVISVTFDPTQTGSRSGNITITDNASPSTQTVSLSGTGTQSSVSLSPTSLTFGNQPERTRSAAQTVTLTNNGSATLTITSIVITGSDPAAFAQTNTCGSSVAAGASCTISVTFDPAKTGTFSAEIKVTDNASPNTQTVALTGTGIT